jgi:hypothetical protein
MQPYNFKTFPEYLTNMIDYLVVNSSGLTNFNVGSRIRSLLEAIAYELSRSDADTLRGFISAIREGMYGIFGFERKPGTVAVGYVTITRPTSQPTGNIDYPIFQIDLYGVKFESTQVNVMGDGQPQFTIEVKALDAGLEGNILSFSIDTDQGNGTIIPLGVDPILYNRVYNAVDFEGGTEQESDADREGRFQAFIQNLGKSTEQGIRAEILKHPQVVEAVVLSNVNPFTGLSETGWVTIYISDGTVAPPQSLIDEITKIVEGDINDITNYPGLAAAGVRVYVGGIDVLEVDISVSIDVKIGSSLTDLQVQNLIASGSFQYINYLPMGEDMLIETLKAYILRKTDDFYRVYVTSPAADVVVQPNKMAKLRNLTYGAINRVTPL